jgi:hypothetical protein
MASQLVIYTGTISGTVGSLITALDAILVTGAGWTKAYSGTNKAAYYNTLATNHCYVRVDDNATGTGGAKEALITGYETMTDVDTGNGPFPTTALGAGGTIAAYPVRKSNTADGTARNYVAFADAATIYFFVLSGDTAGAYSSFGFGKFDTKGSGDTWNNFCVANNAQNTAGGDQLCQAISAPNQSDTDGAGRTVAQRTYTGVAGAVILRKVIDTAFTAYTHGGSGGFNYLPMSVGILPYPNAVDGGLYVIRVRLHETSATFRGLHRGLWSSCHPLASFNDGDTFTGAGTLAGKTFRVVKTVGGATSLLIIETSATVSDP